MPTGSSTLGIRSHQIIVTDACTHAKWRACEWSTRPIFSRRRRKLWLHHLWWHRWRRRRRVWRRSPGLKIAGATVPRADAAPESGTTLESGAGRRGDRISTIEQGLRRLCPTVLAVCRPWTSGRADACTHGPRDRFRISTLEDGYRRMSSKCDRDTCGSTADCSSILDTTWSA